MRLRELQDEREAFAEFIDIVLSRLNARSELFRNDLNTFVATYTTALATTTNIRPTVAAVQKSEEATSVHTERLTNTLSQLPSSDVDPVPLRSPKPQAVVSSPGGPSSLIIWGFLRVYASVSCHIHVGILLVVSHACL